MNLEVEHEFTDRFSMRVNAGRSNSVWDGTMRLQTFIDAIDVDNFTLDFSGGRETPIIGFGEDLSQPGITVGDNEFWRYQPTPVGK